MDIEKEDLKKNEWVLGQVAREVEPVVVHKESGTQLSLFEVLVLILNKLDKIEVKLKK